MRVLISSNAPWSPTGYGVQIKRLAPGLKAMGHSVAIHAWWGLEGGPTTWEGIPVFPRHMDGYGNDAAPYYCRHFKADLLLTLIDLWVLSPDLGRLGSTRWVPYFPIDHADPIPPIIAQRFQNAHRLLVYSKYADREVRAYADGRYADKVRYIPHGVPTDVLTPCSLEERTAFRGRLFPEEPDPASLFIVGMVAANKGYPSRKSFPEAMEAFARFHRVHPEARLYLHSYAETEFQGPNLHEMAQHFGIDPVTRLANPRLLLAGAFDEETMRQIYCAMDVLLAPSQGEGFGLPIVEAQSCGTSVIVSDHSAMSELVGCGWRVLPLRTTPSLILGRFAEADSVGVYHALEECYRRPASPYWATIAREFALTYSWNKVLPLWGTLLSELEGGRRELALELENPAHSAYPAQVASTGS